MKNTQHTAESIVKIMFELTTQADKNGRKSLDLANVPHPVVCALVDVKFLLEDFEEYFLTGKLNLLAYGEVAAKAAAVIWKYEPVAPAVVSTEGDKLTIEATFARLQAIGVDLAERGDRITDMLNKLGVTQDTTQKTALSAIIDGLNEIKEGQNDFARRLTRMESKLHITGENVYKIGIAEGHDVTEIINAQGVALAPGQRLHSRFDNHNY